jgi:exopolysaccharide biosynthesis polyprenyl glycosylphosphotransferase
MISASRACTATGGLVIRRHIAALRLSLMAADALTAMALFVGVSLFRFGDDWVPTWQRAGVNPFLGLAVWGAIWVLVLWLHGLYRLRAHWSDRAQAEDVFRATLLVAVFVFVALFAINLPGVSRLFLIVLFAAQLAVGVLSRLAIRHVFMTARARGLSRRNVLIAGIGPAAESFADRIERHRELGLRVIGHLSPVPAVDVEPRPRRPILGTLDEIEDVLHGRVVDEVAVCLPLDDWGLVEAITTICANEGKVVRIPSEGSVPHLLGASVEQFDGLTVQSLVYGPDRDLSLLLKRLIDLVGATVLVALLSPLLIGIALAIRIRDGSPVTFRQTRVGLHGRTFRVVKFRTMVRDAESQLDGLLEQNEIAGPAFKLTEDPRISRIGRVLRRTSLDELPQLWNVLRGDMSLVGPRPPLPSEVAGYDVWHRRRLSMKPGMTGLWQVSERRSPSFDRWVSIDLDYIDRWSLWLDFKIIARTLPAMLEGR